MEAAMLQHEQLIIGVAVGLILSATLRWTPSWRTLLATLVAAEFIDLAINYQEFAGPAAGSLHVCPCVALVFIGMLAVIHVTRGK
jgi:hypothetical protein